MTLLEMLAARHADAVFVPECKLGEAGSRRLDAWVLLKTWSPMTTVGYEIKVSRADFVRDAKWTAYLPVCHQLYFVSPRHLIEPSELPQDVGLLWTAGSRLQTAKLAPRRTPDPEALSRLMVYVLMSRTRVVANMWEANGPTSGEFWRQWLADKRENQELGARVSRRIRTVVRAARDARAKAERDAARLEHVARRMEALGVDRDSGPVAFEHALAGGKWREQLKGARRLAERILRETEEPQDVEPRDGF